MPFKNLQTFCRIFLYYILHVFSLPASRTNTITYRYSSSTQAQYHLSSHLVVLPHSSFNLLMSSIGSGYNPDAKELIILTQTGKSGSKLICDGFKTLPNTKLVRSNNLLKLNSSGLMRKSLIELNFVALFWQK